MSEKLKKVQLSKPMTWRGTNYAPGLNEMPSAAADYAVKKGFGKTGKGSVPHPADFEPLSLEETMKRFSEGDSSEVVFESLKFHQKKFHQKAIVEGQNKGQTQVETIAEVDGENSEEGGKGDETEEKTKAEAKTEEVSELPEDFPMRHVFAKLGFKSAAEVQAKSREELISLNGIAEATADKALAYGK